MATLHRTAATDWREAIRRIPTVSDAYWDTATGGLRAAARKGLDGNPMLVEYASRFRSKLGVRNIAPWMALAEKFTVMYGLATLPSETWNWNLKPPEQGLEDRYVDDLLLCMMGSHTYLWKQKVIDICAESPLPDHVISLDDVPFPMMFFSFEVAWGSYTFVNGARIDAERNWMQITAQGKGTQLVVTSDLTGLSKPGFAQFIIPVGARYPQDFGNPERVHAIGMVLKMLAFLNSKYVSCERQKIERGLRRRMERANVVGADSSISVVTLRTESRDASTVTSIGDVDWKHRWWVRGHYRAQWLPSTKSHRLTWIAPFLKGPEDKPIAHRIYDVKR